MTHAPQSPVEVAPTAAERLRAVFHAHSLLPPPGQTVVVVGRSGAPRVLVVEDEDAVRYMLLRALQQGGCGIVAPPDSTVGAQLLRDPAEHFDLLLTDVRMPGIDGLELARIAAAARPAEVRALWCP